MLQAILSTANSALLANASRVSAIADNIVNANTPGFKSKDVRTKTLATEQTSRTSFTPGGVQTVLVEDAGSVELASQLIRLIQTEAAYSASAALIRAGDELHRETVDIRA